MSHFVPKAAAIDLFGIYSDFSFKSVPGVCFSSGMDFFTQAFISSID